MSSSSFMPKSLRNFFLRKSTKKRQQEDADAATVGDSATTGSPDYRHPPLQDIYYGEDAVGSRPEDYDFDLGIAISRSENPVQNASSVDGAESASSARYRASYSHGPSSHSEALSSAYYFHGIVDYDERITDGFYDVWGEFNEALRSKPFPSLKALKRLKLEDGDLREVVLFLRSRDSVFPLVEDAAHDAMMKLMDRGTIAIVQALAQIVSAQMGGAAMDERALVRSWQKCSQKLKRKYRSAVYPIGRLKVGLSRHRAFLYKALADSLNIGCRLVRGYPYHTSSSQAVALVIIDNTEVIVDLIVQPGRLLKPEGGGPDEVSTKVTFAEAPGMPSEPYWIPIVQKSKRYQSLLEGSCVQDESKRTFVQGIPEEELNTQGQQQGASLRPTESAFSTVRDPFDSSPQPVNQLDMMRDDSSALSSNPRQPSDASSTSSMQVAMKTQNSGMSLFSESNGWTEDTESPRVGNNRVPASRAPSTNPEEPKKTTVTNFPESERADSSPAGQVPVATSCFSVFANYNDLPPWDDEDENTDAPGSAECIQNEMCSTSTVPRNNPFPPNNQPSNLGSALSALYDADFSILRSEIEIEAVRLGVGSYGEVFKGTWRGTEVAIKRLLEQDVSAQILEEFLLEVKIMKCLRHPNVLLFMGACMQPPDLAIVSEYLPRGSLYKLLHKTNLTDQRLKLRMARDVAKGMCYLHSFKPPIVHRDLKSPNLLVDKDWTVKVCDFGMSRMKANTYLSGKGSAGTPEWTAPEVLRNERSDEKCDVYSYGVILYELVTGLEPWQNLKPMQVVGAVGFNGEQLELPMEVDPKIATIIKRCWSRDPRARPSFSELLKMLAEFDSLPCLPRPT